MMLSNTKLSTTVQPDFLFKIQVLGQEIAFDPSEIIFQEGDNSDYLYVILEGDILIEMGSKQDAWIGAGDIIGEIGFLLGSKRTRTVRAGSLGCRLWSVPRSLLFQQSNIETSILMTHLLLGLAPHIEILLLEIVNDRDSLDSKVKETENYCDFDHPAIQAVATLLRGKDDWESAINIWEFVQSMPYRFGFWHFKASQTLELGFGMCTTKTHLQVALLRALGIESQFGEKRMDSKYVKPFLLPAYHSKIKKKIKHYFCLVKLDGQWFRSDASYSKEAMQLLAESDPEMSHFLHERFERGKEFFLGIEDKVKDSLSDLMQKRPFYKEGNVESMNILLDKRQGTSMLAPHWVKPTLELLSYNPKVAFLRAMAGLIVSSEKLHSVIKKRNLAYEDYKET